MFRFQTESDFNRAQLKAFLREIVATVSRRPNELVSFETVRRSLKIFGENYRGVRPVRVGQIVGSATLRYHDFDRAFLPTQARTKSRWKRVDEAYYEDVALPPVKLYQVGQVYFVRDGHHRVSVAREKGQEFIDAEVIEMKTKVPLTLADLSENMVEIAGMHVDFMEKTQLDQLRPENSIHFSEPGGYIRLIEHIAVHRYYLGIEQKRPIRWQDAVISWYDHLYGPIAAAIRAHNVLGDFPHRTEADLYLWTMDHYYFLREQDESVELEDAVVDFAENFSQRFDKRMLRSVRQAVTTFLGTTELQPVIGTMVSEPHPPEATPPTEERKQ
jgi:hypothetical protein